MSKLIYKKKFKGELHTFIVCNFVCCRKKEEGDWTSPLIFKMLHIAYSNSFTALIQIMAFGLNEQQAPTLRRCNSSWWITNVKKRRA
jgi:hypothetical protein